LATRSTLPGASRYRVVAGRKRCSASCRAAGSQSFRTISPGIVQARKEGKPHGRPITAGLHLQKVKELFRKGVSKREIAKQIGISRTSVRRLLAPPDRKSQIKH